MFPQPPIQWGRDKPRVLCFPTPHTMSRCTVGRCIHGNHVFNLCVSPLLLLVVVVVVVYVYIHVGTDVNATDARGVTPLHLALSRLRMLGEGESGKKEGGGDRGVVGMGGGGESTVPSFRKKEITHVSCLTSPFFLPWSTLRCSIVLLWIPCCLALCHPFSSCVHVPLFSFFPSYLSSSLTLHPCRLWR